MLILTRNKRCYILILESSDKEANMADGYKLPVSSYDELVKIIKTYGNGKVGVAVSLDDLVKSSGMSRTVLSKNNGFLMQTGLITEGNKKAPTEYCSKLAKAYNMNLQEHVIGLWRNILDQDEFVSSMISVISIKGRMLRNDFINHIIYSAGCSAGPTYKAGAAALVDILKIIGSLYESEGYIMLGDIDQNAPMTNVDSSIETDLVESGGEKGSNANVQAIQSETNFYIQQYTCESGLIAKIIIPENATEDDLLGFRDMLNIALKRKFKIKED